MTSRLHSTACSRDFDFEVMTKSLCVGWGELGERTANAWREFNDRYFNGCLRPLPIFFVPTTPYGKAIGWTCCQQAVTHIALAHPRNARLAANRCTLLHEMIHQWIHETGRHRRSPNSHALQPWFDEIMRLHLAITSKPLWAAAPINTNGRRPRPHPQTGELSIAQPIASRWPYSMQSEYPELNLGPL
jgi:hypothetical protein